MKIYYREKSGGIEILRCFGIEGRVEIPGMIDGKLVISAAPYAFSSHMDGCSSGISYAGTGT